MKYPLQQLLQVRLFREERAQAEVTAARQAVERAEELVRTRQQQLEEFILHREQREAQLYEEIMDQEVHVNDLDDLKNNISLLRVEQNAYEDRVKEAEKRVKTAESELQQAEQRYAETVKDRQKIDEHRADWAQDEAKRFEALLEKEMEDFRVRKAEEDEAEDWS